MFKILSSHHHFHCPAAAKLNVDQLFALRLILVIFIPSYIHKILPAPSIRLVFNFELHAKRPYS